MPSQFSYDLRCGLKYQKVTVWFQIDKCLHLTSKLGAWDLNDFYCMEHLIKI